VGARWGLFCFLPHSAGPLCCRGNTHGSLDRIHAAPLVSALAFTLNPQVVEGDNGVRLAAEWPRVIKVVHVADEANLEGAFPTVWVISTSDGCLDVTDDPNKTPGMRFVV